MRGTWKVLGMTAALLAVAPFARAHELDCEKTVNGETLLELSEFPATLTYELKINNIHPESASEVQSAVDPMFPNAFKTPFTIPFGESKTKEEKITVGSYEACLELAKKDGTEDDIIENVLTVGWDSGEASCEAQVHCVKPDEGNKDTRRMTGGGSVFGTGKDRVTHGFELRCDDTDPRQNLEVNRGGDNFHLTDLTSAVCSDDPSISEGHPVAGFDTFVGTGVGTWNKQPATVEFTFTDAGEPGKNDRARIVVKSGGSTVLSVDGTLKFGNQQAHP